MSKYLKYKNKYLEIKKKMLGGAQSIARYIALARAGSPLLTDIQINDTIYVHESLYLPTALSNYTNDNGILLNIFKMDNVISEMIQYILLLRNGPITTLSIDDCTINKIDAMHIATGLSKNTSIGILAIGVNNTNIFKEDSLNIILVAAVTAEIGLLNIENQVLNIDNIQSINQLLTVNINLTYLMLDNNNIGNEGCIALARVLATNISLTHLCLYTNNIDSEGGVALARMLTTNTTLTNLLLDNNNIGNEGCVALARMLTTNTTLTDLLLDNNNIGSEGYIALAQVLATNNGLITLHLRYNILINSEILEEFIKSLLINFTLTSLDIEGADILIELLKYNASLPQRIINHKKNITYSSVSLVKNKMFDKREEVNDILYNSILEMMFSPKESRYYEFMRKKKTKANIKRQLQYKPIQPCPCRRRDCNRTSTDPCLMGQPCPCKKGACSRSLGNPCPIDQVP